MTPKKHYKQDRGHLSGTVIGESVDGYFVKSTDGVRYFVVGGPLYTKGTYIDKMYVISKGKRKASVTIDTDSGAEVKSAALMVMYNDRCNDDDDMAP